MTTKGEYRVGITFNPSRSGEVDIIKALTAQLIDAVEAIDTQDNQERGRLKSLAQTAYEEAAMWAVKAATKQPMEGGIAPRPPLGTPQADPIFEATLREVVTEVFGVWEGSYRMIPPDNAQMRCLRGMEKRGFRGVKSDDFIATWRAMLKREGK